MASIVKVLHIKVEERLLIGSQLRMASLDKLCAVMGTGRPLL